MSEQAASNLESDSSHAERSRGSIIGIIALTCVLGMLWLSWFGAWTTWPIWMLVAWIAVAGLCVLGLCFRPRRAAITGIAILAATTGVAVYEIVRFNFLGHLRVSEYPLLLQAKGQGLDFFPRSIPPEARGVTIIAGGMFLPVPTLDDFIELRFVLPPQMAVALDQDLASRAIGVDPSNTDCYLLRTVSGADSRPPILPSFKTYRFCPPNSTPLLMVTINPTTGEVVYWRFET